MCLAVVAIEAHPDFPFICIGNRDEFHNRPTAPLHYWNDHATGLWAGKDMQQGGTWLGLGKNGEFALLTNVRNNLLNMGGNSPSRGELVVNAILEQQGPTKKQALAYSGFNLIHGSLPDLQLNCTSNQGLRLGNSSPFSTVLKAGIHGLSNGHLDAPWPKTRLLKNNLQALIKDVAGQVEKNHDPLELEKTLFSLLSQTDLAEDEELPSTGVPHEWEKMLSAVKIVSPHYGTRSSAVVLMDKTGLVRFTEVTFNPQGEETGRQRFEIPL